MIHKILSIINVNKVDDPIFNVAMAEVVEICEKVKAGTYQVKPKQEKKEEKKENKKPKQEKKEYKKSMGI